MSGSTNIYGALRAALILAKKTQGKTDSDGNPYPPTIIFFVTDGEPTSGIIKSSEILRRLQNSTVPIYSIAFGSEAEYDLCRNLSIQSGGLARKIFDNGDAALRFLEFYQHITSKSLQNVTFKYVLPLETRKEVNHETFLLHYRDLTVSEFGNMAKLENLFDNRPPAAVVLDSTVMDLPCAENCFMEKLYALQRIGRLL